VTINSLVNGENPEESTRLSINPMADTEHQTIYNRRSNELTLSHRAVKGGWMPEFENKISIGTVLQIAALCVVAIGGYYNLSLKTDEHTRQIQTLQTQFIRADVAAEHDRRIDDKLDEINRRLGQIETNVKEKQR
jgi:uncharacterized protein HemX